MIFMLDKRIYDYTIFPNNSPQKFDECCKKIEKEFKLPEPFKYNVISRNGGADVEIYTPNISDLRATTTTMKGTKHIQEWFDIDGLWQVNILDDNGNFKKYEYVTGWQNAIKIFSKHCSYSMP